MKQIGGNITACLQVKDDGTKNAIGERTHEWIDVTALKGWLDLSTGDSQHLPYMAKLQDSTHIFMCDFKSLKALSAQWVWNPFNLKTGVINQVSGTAWKWGTFNLCTGIVNALTKKTVDATSENARMVIKGSIYQIQLIDDPMDMHQQLEIYLKYTGG